MKKMLFVIFAMCFLYATAALGQSASGAAPITSTFQISSHPEHASPRPMAQEQSLLEGPGSGYLIAQGERPLWEFATVKQEIPLGDIARAQKQEHSTTKKARFVREY
jgi:hypothetical protein